jgi:hypothetical protein
MIAPLGLGSVGAPGGTRVDGNMPGCAVIVPQFLFIHNINDLAIINMEIVFYKPLTVCRIELFRVILGLNNPCRA